jgi:hypothetical protein
MRRLNEGIVGDDAYRQGSRMLLALWSRKAGSWYGSPGAMRNEVDGKTTARPYLRDCLECYGPALLEGLLGK